MTILIAILTGIGAFLLGYFLGEITRFLKGWWDNGN
jgi:ABC-type dipeptide/oligopeptide/nickel transport system permease subunit